MVSPLRVRSAVAKPLQPISPGRPPFHKTVPLAHRSVVCRVRQLAEEVPNGPNDDEAALDQRTTRRTDLPRAEDYPRAGALQGRAADDGPGSHRPISRR